MGPKAGMAGGKSRPHRDSIPVRPARNSVAIPTELPGPRFVSVIVNYSVSFASVLAHITCVSYTSYFT